MGLGAFLFPDDGIEETVVPIQVRLRLGHFGLEFGHDSMAIHDPVWFVVFGLYRAGVLVYPYGGEPVPPLSIRPYAYGRLAYLLGPAEDDRPHVWNVGAHLAAGVGFEWSPHRLGLYWEAGVLRDLAGEFLAPSIAAGVVYRFGAP